MCSAVFSVPLHAQTAYSLSILLASAHAASSIASTPCHRPVRTDRRTLKHTCTRTHMHYSGGHAGWSRRALFSPRHGRSHAHAAQSCRGGRCFASCSGGRHLVRTAHETRFASVPTVDCQWAHGHDGTLCGHSLPDHVCDQQSPDYLHTGFFRMHDLHVMHNLHVLSYMTSQVCVQCVWSWCMCDGKHRARTHMHRFGTTIACFHNIVLSLMHLLWRERIAWLEFLGIQVDAFLHICSYLGDYSWFQHTVHFMHFLSCVRVVCNSCSA